MKKSVSIMEKIDVVYTWVDNADKNWINKKQIETKKYRIPLTSNSIIGRFNNHDELRYSIRSVEKYIPWVRKIFIVTDSQKPAWLKVNKKIKIIDHKQILPSYIKKPVFNSLQIEFYLHRIPGLSEKFIYFNDDFFINKKLSEEDFFIKNKCVRYITEPFIHEYRIPKDILNAKIKDSVKLINKWFLKRKKTIYFHDNSLDLFHILNPSFNIKFNLKHLPYSITKKEMKNIHKKYKEFIKNMNLNQFRAKNDLFILSLITASELEENNAIFLTDDNDLFEYALGQEGFQQNIHDIYNIFEDKYKFFNISEGNKPKKEWIELAINLLMKRFKKISKFENPSYSDIKKQVNNDLINKYKKIYNKEKNHITELSLINEISEKKKIIRDLIIKKNNLKESFHQNKEKLDKIVNSRFYKIISKIEKFE